MVEVLDPFATETDNVEVKDPFASQITEEEKENVDLEAAKELEQRALELRDKAKQNNTAQFPILTGANIEGKPGIDLELFKYVKTLQKQIGSYEKDDLLAAGFTEEQITAYENAENISPAEEPTETAKAFLPEPSSDMYDALKMGYEEDTTAGRVATGDTKELTAFELYNAYADSENTVADAFGNLYYNDPRYDKTFRIPYPQQSGTAVPILSSLFNKALETLAPDYYAGRDAGVNEGTILLEQIVDSATNTLEVGAAAVDFVSSAVGKDTSLLEWTNSIPTSSSGMSKVDAVAGEGAGLAASFMTGRVVLDAAGKGATSITKKFMSPLTKSDKWKKDVVPVLEKAAEKTNGILKYTGGELGIALGSDTETTSFLKPFNVDPNDPEAEQILAARMNIFVDSLIMSGVIDSAATAGLKLADFVNQASVGAVARSLFEGDDAKMTSAMENILDTLASVEASSTKSSMEEARQRLIKEMAQNRSILIEGTAANKEGTEIVLDAFSALETGDALSPQTIAKINQLRKGIVTDSKNEGRLLAQSDNLNVQTDRILQEEIDQALPEGSTVTDAAGTIIDSNTSRLSQQQNVINDLQQAAQTADEATLNAVLSDKTLAGPIERLTGVPSSQLSALSVARRQEIAKTLIDEAERMTKQKNDLFNSIPDGAQFDIPAFGDLIDRLSKETDQFGTEGAEFLSRRLIATIKAAYKKTKPNAEAPSSSLLDQYGNPLVTEATDPKDLAEELFAQGVDFKKLYNDIRPEIAKLTDEAFTNGKGGVGGRLREVLTFIDEQVEYVAKNNPEAKDAATDAMNYYKEEFIPLWGDTPLKETYQTFKDTRSRGIEPTTEAVQSQNQVTAVLEGGKQEEVGKLVSALGVSKEGADADTVQEYITARMFEDLYADVTQKGLQNLDPAQISSRIKAYSDQLRGNFDILASQMDALESRIRTAQQRGSSVAEELSEAQKIFDTMEIDAFSKLVGGLVDKYNPGVVSANVENKLAALMNSTDGADGISSILKETGNNPLVVGGLKKVYLEELRKKAFNIATESTTGAPVGNVSKIRNVLQENTGLAASGEIILGGDPQLNSVVKTILTSASDAQAKRNAKALPGSSGTPEIQQYQGAINTMVNVIVGPLNRIGTQARTAGRIAAEKLDIANRYAIAMDAVVADSNLALKVIQDIETRRASKGIGPFRLPRDMYDDVFSLGIRIGRYAEADRDEIYKTWDEMVVDAADDVDTALEEGKEKAGSLKDQMLKILGLDR